MIKLGTYRSAPRSRTTPGSRIPGVGDTRPAAASDHGFAVFVTGGAQAELGDGSVRTIANLGTIPVSSVVTALIRARFSPQSTFEASGGKLLMACLMGACRMKTSGGQDQLLQAGESISAVGGSLGAISSIAAGARASWIELCDGCLAGG